MINIANLPVVRDQIEREAAAPADGKNVAGPAPRAPFNVTDLPGIREQLERDTAALKERHTQRAKAMAKAAAPRYARAPEASGPQATGGRPPATQRNTR